MKGQPKKFDFARKVGVISTGNGSDFSLRESCYAEQENWMIMFLHRFCTEIKNNLMKSSSGWR
jgi:hypothetical protein